jgi:protein-tyrosine phosphatase
MLVYMLSSREMCRSPEGEVPEPFNGGPEGFEHVLDLVEEASGRLLKDIRGRRLESGV